MAVLADAIIAVEEDYKEQIAREENEASFTKEQISERNQALSEIKEYYEKRGICFDLPNIEEEENDLFLEEEIRLHHIKGTLAFPCCAAEKVAVYKDTKGKCVLKCPNCGTLSVFDFDAMRAETVADKRKSGTAAIGDKQS